MSQTTDRPASVIPFPRAYEVAALDVAERSAEPLHGPRLRVNRRLSCLHRERRVLLGDGRPQGLAQRTILSAGALRLPDPNIAVSFGDLFGKPFERFDSRRRRGQRDEPVDQLQSAEAAQLPPDGDAGPRGLSWHPVGE